MSVKSILDVEIAVKDEKFKEFLKTFNEFHSKLAGMSAEWGKLLDKGSTTRTKDAKALEDAVSRTNTEIKKTTESTRDLGFEMNKIVTQFERQAPSIVKTIGSFLGPVGTALTVGVGAGWLVGKLFSAAQQKMYALGDAAISSQKQSRSLNLNAGELRAYQNDFGRLADTSMLEKVAAAKYDPKNQVYLMMAAGMKDLGETQKMNPVDLISKIILNAHQFMNTAPVGLRNSAGASAMGFTQLGFSATDMALYGNTPKNEIQKARTDYYSDKEKLGISEGSASKFYEQNRQMDLSVGRSVSRNIYKFDDLAVSAGNLSKAFADAQDRIYNSFTGQNKYIQAPISGAQAITNALSTPFNEKGEFVAKPFNAQAEVQNNLNQFKSQNALAPVSNMGNNSRIASSGSSSKGGVPQVGVTIFNATGNNLTTSINGASR